MDKEFFDKILDQVIEEASTIYVENEELENPKIEDEDVEFSDLHKQKMKQLFKEVRKEDNKKKAVKITKRVAIVLLCTILITCGLITTVEAWREEVIKFIMKNNDNNYMCINFGDTRYDNELTSGDTESGETEENNQFIIDEIKFLYLPEGFEFKQKYSKDNMEYYSFINDREFIKLKKDLFQDNYGIQSDIEKASNEKIEFEDKEVFKIIKESNRINYVWYDENYLYEVSSNISNEDTLKFIENIKILKNF